MSHPKESCVDEVQPLRSATSSTVTPSLKKEHHPLCGSPDSFLRKRSLLPRQCIICFLILLVIGASIATAFLIGHWLELDQQGNDQSLKLIKQLTPSKSPDPPPLTTTTSLSPSAQLTTPAVPILREVLTERIIPLEGRRPRKPLTVQEVYPPNLENYHMLDELHSTGANPKKNDTLLVQLPLHVLPLHYDLLLDLTRFGDHLVRGNLSIHLDSYGNSSDDEIVFHIGEKVSIERLRILRDGKRIYPKTIRREDNKDLCRVLLREQLRRGRYILEIEYNTTICMDDDDKGVHCSEKSFREEGSQVVAFTTKFEPVSARSFLPCWDEPGFKATFNISVLHPAKYVVLSNMPYRKDQEEHRPRNPNAVAHTSFQETPPMSTYLLAFAVGEFQPFEMRTERNIPLTIWTLREQVLSARFTANFAPIMFNKHEEEFEVPYSLPKMDFIAARSFPVDAMENWGLLIFDFRAILMDPGLEDNANLTVDRIYHEFKVERLITHELAHQWFGNLVTMRWFDELWLNEGFATYFAQEFLKDEHPILTDNEYYLRLAHLVKKQSADERFPLVKEMTTKHAVENAFHVTHLYIKGWVVVRMIRDLVSEIDFRAGVKRYLRKNAFRSVSRDELWESLPSHADHGAEQEPLSKVMEGWLVNGGIPTVAVVRNYETDMITVSQKQSVENDYKAFLTGENQVEERRRTRRNVDETTPFDDNLFENFPKDWIGSVPKKKHKKKRRKLNRPALPRTEVRREELRLPRRAAEPSDTWSIPFSYMFGSVKSSEGQVVRQFWLKNHSLSFADVELLASQPLIANPEWAFPYRVNYDYNNWKLLARQLHHNPEEIPTKSRTQIIVDSEMFLAHSDSPHLYIYLLGYLSREPDLGVALMGLDAIYHLVDGWRGSKILNSLLLYLSPVVAHFDKLLDASQANPEEAALWLLEPSRLSKLYQLRCVTNLPSCDQDSMTKKWLLYSNSAEEDVYRQSTAVCQYLFTNMAEAENALLESKLRTRRSSWSSYVQLAACSKEDRIAKLAAKQIVATRNAAIYASGLKSDFSLHYNRKFRSALWHQIGRLQEEERIFLFSANETAIQPVSKILLHSVRTMDELKHVEKLVPKWYGDASKHVEYLERKMNWMESMENGVLQDFFNGDAFI